jgi:hypothetical protein
MAILPPPMAWPVTQGPLTRVLRQLGSLAMSCAPSSTAERASSGEATVSVAASTPRRWARTAAMAPRPMMEMSMATPTTTK